MADESQTMAKEDIVITRILEAPLALVWKAWTDCEYVKRWWGPKYYTAPDCKIDLRVGGKLLFTMRAPEMMGGQDSYTAGEYLQIVPMELLEFTQSLADKDGNAVDPQSVGMPADFPPVIRTVIVFRPIGELTELTITEYSWTPGQMMVYSYAGMHQCIDKMAEVLKHPAA